MGDDRNIRHRFTVPKDDTQVEEWIMAQSNLGFSLRVLIRAFVRSYGYRDATCMELGTPVKRVGRPPKQAQIALGNMMAQDPAPLFPVEEEAAEEMVEHLMAREQTGQAVRPQEKPPETPVRQNPPQSQGGLNFGNMPQGSSIEQMMGMQPPSKSQQDLMANIMNLE